MILPNVWGAGQLFAFSGAEGPTDWNVPFVFQTAARPGHLQLRLPMDLAVQFRDLPDLRFSIVLGDALVAESGRGSFQAAFADHHTLIGEFPAGTKLVINDSLIGDEATLVAKTNGVEVFAFCRANRWALFATAQPAEAADLARRAMDINLAKTISDRTAYVRDFPVPAGLNEEQTRLLGKAISVMKVNVETACGKIKRRWTTPDRWPHRNMWLWDSAFHGIGLSFVDPNLGQDAVLAMLEQVQTSGMLSHMVTPVEQTEITQPPVLAWSAWTLFQKTNDHEWAGACLPYLVRYLEWIRLNRDKNDNGIPEWFIEGNALCRSGESGLDNSSRFDSAVLLDAVDFGGFLCHEYRCLAQLAHALGDLDLQQTCTRHADRIAHAINALLWSQEEGFYLDRRFDGTFIDVKAVSGFVPLFAGIAEPYQAEALRRHLANPATFGATFPVPSLALNSGTYCKDMWRGPAWINFNYMIYQGLRRYGFDDDARRLKRITLATIAEWYCREGCLFEFYDSLNLTSPRDLDRKQRLSQGYGYEPISDYHWTAALTAAFLLDGFC